MSLIKIYKGNLVNARELHQKIVVEAKGGQKGEVFANWIKRMLDYDFKLKEDYLTIGYNYKGEIVEENGVAKFSKSDNQRVSKRDYFLTLDCAKQIAMIQNNDKGREIRKYFIEAEKTLVRLKENKRLEAFKDGLVDLTEAEELNKAAHNEVRQTIINNTRKTPEQFDLEKDIKLLKDDEGNEAIE